MTRSGGLLCAIHQPNLFPRLSTLAKLFTADIWIALDDVQFARRDYQHRARLGRHDDPNAQQWMSLPVRSPNGRRSLINDIMILERDRSIRRILRMTRQHHGRGRHWSAVEADIGLVAEMISRTESLADVAITSTLSLLELLHWPGTVVRSSDFVVSADRSTRLADLTHAVGATTYLCGTGGANYLRPDLFDERDIGVTYFSVPTATRHEVWAGAQRLSSIAAMASAGVSAVQRAFEREVHLRHHLATRDRVDRQPKARGQ
ncbi:WbqC family protein [Kribbella sp. NBC_01510]|uniref:WbqC family protein n=1 Tax=Kribbella sp. NBC_01510 TaxID=2903581 RepID=UPI0038632887